MRSCECEHEEHFPSEDGREPKNHVYMQLMPDSSTRLVQHETMGLWNLCESCIDHCHKGRIVNA